MSEIERYTLPNCVRILVERVDYVRSAAVGLWCTTGSSNENEDEAGISHCIEHMLFKGTAARSAKEIAEAIEGRGGALNAFTDQESTCYYCRVLSDDLAVGVDVLSDMLLNSSLNEDELAREEGVIVEEILRSRDEPSDYVHDLHMEQRWQGHVLGRPIAGTPDSVRSFRPEHLRTYMARRYTGPNVLLAVAGNVDSNALRDIAEAALGSLGGKEEHMDLSRPGGTAADTYVERDVEQIHFCIGSDGCSVYDDDIYALTVLDAALGGAMSSRLFQEVREKRGLAYAIGSYRATFAAGGAFTVYGGTSVDKWVEVRQVVRDEFDKVMESGLDSEEMERTKRLICGNTVLALEGMSARMMRMSKHEIYHRRDIPIEETLSRIRAVSPDDVLRVARQVLDPRVVSTTAIGPKPN